MKTNKYIDEMQYIIKQNGNKISDTSQMSSLTCADKRRVLALKISELSLL